MPSSHIGLDIAFYFEYFEVLLQEHTHLGKRFRCIPQRNKNHGTKFSIGVIGIFVRFHKMKIMFLRTTRIATYL